jgi:prepilin-type N-terminal cleavage/methylation domain-containing protein
MKTHMQRNAGFSLTELLVTLAIVSIFSAALYGVYVGQFKAHATQNATVDIQQDLRNSLYVLQRSIRMAGYDPSLGVRNNSPASLGIVGQFPSPHHYNGGSGPGTRIAANGKCQSIAFTLDANGDQVDSGTGVLLAGAGTIEANDLEYVAFRLSAGELQKYRPSLQDWVTVAENIATLDFEFLGEDDSNPKAAADGDTEPDSFSADRNGNGRADIDDDGDGFPDSDMLARVRYVRITLTAKRMSDVIAWGGSKPAHSLSAIVQIRNHS